MVNQKSKVFLVVVSVLVLALSACASSTGNANGTPGPAATGFGARRDQNLASTQNPFPAGVEGSSGAASQVPFPAGATVVPSVLPGTQAPTAGTPSGANTPAAGTPGATAAVPNTGGTPAAVPDTNGQLLGAKVNPADARSQAVLLSNVMNYNVVDRNGHPIGKVSDYILNMCESNIIYMVIDADPSLNLQNGSMLVVPYQEFTLASGVIDVNNHNLVMNIDQSSFQGAPAFNQKPDLSNTSWESDVRDYWTNIVQLSALSTQCQVPQGPVSASQTTTPSGTAQATVQADNTMVTKIAYASDVLGMQLLDGQGNPVGQVNEVYLVPESGRIRYLAIDKSGAQQPGTATQAATPMSTPAATSQSAQSGNMQIVIIPIGAVNLQQSQSGQGNVLVLVVTPQAFQGAPVLSGLPDVSQQTWDANAYQYWNQYVPLTSEQQKTAEASTPTP